MLLFLFPLLILGFDVSRGEIVLDKGQPRVDTEYGTVYGSVETLKSKKEIYTFKGIPFAAAPVGQLRFEKPQTVRPFGVINGTQFRPQCITFITGPAMLGQEDCLFLNIAVPKFAVAPTKLYPIMVLVVGGGHVKSDVDKLHTDHFHEYFVARGIIYVTFHYRVGALGYYSNGTYPSSNVALFDMLEALRFVQRVIREFNGDPDRVTLFGFSAGSVAISLLSFSHRSNGLFQQTINFCGNAHTITSRGKRAFESSRSIEKYLGCSDALNKKECLKNKPVEDIWRIDTNELLQYSDDMEATKWAPTIHNSDFKNGLTYEEALMTAPNVPSLYGLNTAEDTIAGIQRKVPPGTKYCPVLAATAANFTRDDRVAATKYLLTKDGAFGDKKDEVINKIIRFYEDKGKDNPEHRALQAYLEMFTDLHYGMGAIREAKMKAKHNRRIYFYLNEYQLPNWPKMYPIVEGTVHCAEAPMVFGVWAGSAVKVEGSLVPIVQNFTDMWVNFVKYRVPRYAGTSLPLVTPHRIPHAVINDKTVFRDNLFRDKVIFWETIAQNYGFDWVTGADKSI